MQRGLRSHAFQAVDNAQVASVGVGGARLA